MAKYRISGLPVVNRMGTLVDVISSRDLRVILNFEKQAINQILRLHPMLLHLLKGIGASGEHFARLFHPISAFKAAVNKEYPNMVLAS